MNYLPIVLLLVLASASASEFLRPFRQFKQAPAGKENVEELADLNDLHPEDRLRFFLPGLISEPSPMDEWTSSADFGPSGFVRTRHSAMAGPEDFRVKRTDASLSIVNALDVLRQQIILELARRKMNESKAQIQRNRELLMKTGKRSVRNYDSLSNCGIRNFLTGNTKRGDDSENEVSGLSAKTGDENSTTRNHNEIPYRA